MTNAEIIYRTSLELAKNGKLEFASEGIPETIHTYAAWKELGYIVKKGEKSAIKFPVWKYRANITHNDETGEDEDKSKMFMKTAAFFTFSQVEKISEAN